MLLTSRRRAIYGWISVALSVAGSIVLIWVAEGVQARDAPGTDLVIELRVHAGPYRYWRTLQSGNAVRDAIAAFGVPSAAGRDTPRSNLCTLRWDSIGLDIGFAGVRGRCRRSPAEGAWYGMRLWGARWRTAKGLRIGDSVGRILRLYPHARYVSRPPRAAEWWLVTASRPGLGTTPLLTAEVAGGRVAAIRVPAGYVF